MSRISRLHNTAVSAFVCRRHYCDIPLSKILAKTSHFGRAGKINWPTERFSRCFRTYTAFIAVIAHRKPPLGIVIFLVKNSTHPLLAMEEEP